MAEEKLLCSLIDDNVKVLVKKETVSTNTDGRTLISEGLNSPALIVADRQTGGRGRQGKSFLSPEGGLYMTLVIPTDMPLSQVIGATSCAAVAVCHAIRNVSGADCGIKWINDIYLSGGKLCGILTESVNDYATMTSKYLIIGIGVNVDTAPVITDSTVRAVSLKDVGISVSREELCAAITNEILETHRRGFDFSLYRNEYVERSVLIGRDITFTQNGTVKHGKATGIDENGALSVYCDGQEIILSSGEVSVRFDET